MSTKATLKDFKDTLCASYPGAFVNTIIAGAYCALQDDVTYYTLSSPVVLHNPDQSYSLTRDQRAAITASSQDLLRHYYDGKKKATLCDFDSIDLDRPLENDDQKKLLCFFKPMKDVTTMLEAKIFSPADRPTGL